MTAVLLRRAIHPLRAWMMSLAVILLIDPFTPLGAGTVVFIPRSSRFAIVVFFHRVPADWPGGRPPDGPGWSRARPVACEAQPGSIPSARQVFWPTCWPYHGSVSWLFPRFWPDSSVLPFSGDAGGSVLVGSRPGFLSSFPIPGAISTTFKGRCPPCRHRPLCRYRWPCWGLLYCCCRAEYLARWLGVFLILPLIFPTRRTDSARDDRGGSSGCGAGHGRTW